MWLELFRLHGRLDCLFGGFFVFWGLSWHVRHHNVRSVLLDVLSGCLGNDTNKRSHSSCTRVLSCLAGVLLFEDGYEDSCTIRTRKNHCKECLLVYQASAGFSVIGRVIFLGGLAEFSRGLVVFFEALVVFRRYLLAVDLVI